MKRICAPGDTACKFKGSVVAVGVFDGVHRGHQKVILRAVAEAKRLRLPSVVVTFDPHPVKVLAPCRDFSYITTIERRLQLIEALGVDACVVIAFSEAFAAQDPAEFIQDLLLGQLGVRKIILGSDFHFGRQRSGTLALLNDFGRMNGFSVETIKLLKKNNINIKSTYIKKLVCAADFRQLKSFLGRRYDFLGVIEHGEGRGRKLGYRTANFKKENVVILPSGIYFVHARCLDGSVRMCSKTLQGLCYVGHKPTFKSPDAPVVYELHLLDCDARLYGQRILMEFLKKERDDRLFLDEKALTQQIARDVQSARRFFSRIQ
ncbi:MAG: riboflavin biosynthesis protein RibF [Candidatus Omnitrophota bacterium]